MSDAKRFKRLPNMEEFEVDLEKLLLGQSVPVTEVDERLDVKDLFTPKTKKNIAYIVAGVFINEAGQILMIQEAKYSCYGTWYLPAGRMEPAENLQEAVIREVQEEAGLQCDPTTLLSVEVGSGAWYRFTFTGKITGGQLKTLDEKDKESLQAEWIDYEHIKNKQLPIRAGDIIPLIDLAFKYRGMPPSHRHTNLLPSLQSYKHLQHRPLIVHKNDKGDLHILINTRDDKLHIPTAYVSPYDFSTLIATYAVINAALEKEGRPKPKIRGVISVEHTGKPKWANDGMCISTLILLESSILPPLCSVDYQWHSPLKSDIKSTLQRLSQKGMCVPVLNIHG